MNASSLQNPASLAFPNAALRALPLVLGTLALLTAACLHAQTTETKLQGRATASQANNAFGKAVAVSDKYLLVGEPLNKDKGTGAGAVHVFNAKTGKYLRKLTAKDAAVGDNFGTSVALSGHIALVGAPYDDEQGNNAGAAYVFDLRTGRQKLKFKPDILGGQASLDGATFGHAVALHRDVVLVGGPGYNGGRGAVFWHELFDTSSSYISSPGVLTPGDNYGTSVALSGNLMVIGAPGDDEKGVNAGAAYTRYITIYQSGSSFGDLHKLTAGDGAANDHFGYSVALSGAVALIGAILDDNANGTDAGAAYLFNARSGAQLNKFTANDGAANDYFGYSVALSGNLALIGVTNINGARGGAYLYNTRNYTFRQKLTASDGAIGDTFGSAVAFNGNHALIGAPGVDDLANNAGAAYLITPIWQPFAAEVESYPAWTGPFDGLSALPGSSPPAAGQVSFKTFPEVFINSGRQAVLQATLTGPAAKGGRNRGVWDTIGGDTRYWIRLKDDLEGPALSKIRQAWSNRPNNTLMFVDYRYQGRGGQALFFANAGSWDYILWTGNGGTYQTLHEVGQSGLDYMAVNARLRRGGVVNKGNDSRIAFFQHAQNTPAGPSITEGDVVNAGISRLGQLFNRVAVSRASNAIYSGASLIFDDGSPARQVLFTKNPTVGGAVNTLAAIQGGIAENTGGATYRSLLGETVSYDGVALWRASLNKGNGVTSKNNEGLWLENGHQLIARKDGQVRGLDAAGNPDYVLRIARILRFWPANGDTQALLLAKLKGRGVKAANDLALLLWDVNAPDYPRILLREGQAVDGTDGARVRVIQRVDVDPRFGNYVVLASLTGAATRNQALFTGDTLVGNAGTEAGRIRRLPVLRLRKGTQHHDGLFFFTNRGMSLPVTVDKTGAGGKGKGQAIAFHQASIASWTALTLRYVPFGQRPGKDQIVTILRP